MRERERGTEREMNVTKAHRKRKQTFQKWFYFSSSHLAIKKRGFFLAKEFL